MTTEINSLVRNSLVKHIACNFRCRLDGRKKSKKKE